MARILRATNIYSPRTPRGVTANARSGAWHDPSQLTRRTTSARTPVRRLFAVDPLKSNAFTPVMNQFTNNANPRFDPSRGPGVVRVLDSTPEPPWGSTSGHQRVIRWNNQMNTGGKRIVRSPAGGYIRRLSTTG